MGASATPAQLGQRSDRLANVARQGRPGVDQVLQIGIDQGLFGADCTGFRTAEILGIAQLVTISLGYVRRFESCIAHHANLAYRAPRGARLRRGYAILANASLRTRAKPTELKFHSATSLKSCFAS